VVKRTLFTGICAATFLVLRLAAQQADAALAPILERAGVHGRVNASCRGGFRPGQGSDFAIAVSDTVDGGRYLVVQDDGRVHELTEYSGKPDLSCYSVTEADRLNASIAKSNTLNGRVVAEWDGTVVCGFIEPTIAVCWQFAQEQRRFVRIGGWTT
jgi:hypothetical protein